MVTDSDQAFRSTPAVDPKVDICDSFFIENLNQLKDLRLFLQQQAIGADTKDSAAFAFGSLNGLRYHSEGRLPNPDEWVQLERLTQTFFGMLSPQLRHKFLMGGIPWILTALPGVFGLVAVIALLLAVFAALDTQGFQASKILGYYVLWLASLGATGSIAFIGMNALSVQEDATFDLTNGRLMTLRVAIGALFGLVISLPIGFVPFADFIKSLAGQTTTGSPALATQAAMLLLPFVLGFSTSLVIMILNQFVEAIQSFFGKRPAPVAAANTLPRSPVTANPTGTTGAG